MKLLALGMGFALGTSAYAVSEWFPEYGISRTHLLLVEQTKAESSARIKAAMAQAAQESLGRLETAVKALKSIKGEEQRQALQDVMGGLNFKEGDTTNYTLEISMLTGAMEMGVDKIANEGVWIHQNVEIMGQKQDSQILIDPNTGEIKKMIVNGKEQPVPQKGDTEIIETKEDTVTVKAGTYKCVYVKARVTVQGQKQEVQQWINLKEIPVFGMAKSIMQQQMGPVTISLEKFKKN
ncbi:MAG: hypothetical protein C5B49_06445 [Bdellovibrio sp.]|nr:MAG: hypothetical protein C5B49_06445 [Bdellovibrio sp.]